MAALPVPPSSRLNCRGCYGMLPRCPTSGLNCSSPQPAGAPAESSCGAIKVNLLAQGHTGGGVWLERGDLHPITDHCEIWHFWRTTLILGLPMGLPEDFVATSSQFNFSLCPILPPPLPSLPTGLILGICPKKLSRQKYQPYLWFHFLWFQLLTVNRGPKILNGKFPKETIHKF